MDSDREERKVSVDERKFSKIENEVKKAPFRVKVVMCALLLALITFLLGLVVIPFYVKSREVGADVGNSIGTTVGMFTGSFEGITKGNEEGAQAGKEAGLAATDVSVMIPEEVREIGRLEVLAAGVKLTNISSLGDQYSQLQILKGDAIFTVDLTEASIVNLGTDEIAILLDKPELDLYIDEKATSTLAEWQEHPWSGTAEDGFKAYMNSRKNAKNEIEKSLSNYDSLVLQAEEAAISQVKKLVESLCNGKTVVVSFK